MGMFIIISVALVIFTGVTPSEWEQWFNSFKQKGE